MELLYLYIPESAGTIFKGEQINFTGRHRFHFDKTSRRLSCTVNDKAVDGSFFTTKKYGKENVVSSISAIIGDNGAGKTAIADFLYKIRIRGGLEYILIWKDSQGKFKWSAYIEPEYITSEEKKSIESAFAHSPSNVNLRKRTFSLGDILIEEQTQSTRQIKINRNSKKYSAFIRKLRTSHREIIDSIFKPIEEKDLPISMSFQSTFNEPFTLIYSSNFYTPLHDIESVNGVIDISTSQYLKKDKENAENGSYTKLHPISAHYYMEMMRNAELIARFKKLPKKLDWKIPTPKGVFITPSTSDLEIFRSDIERTIREAIQLDFKLKFKNENELKDETGKILKRELESDQPQYCSLLQALVYQAIEPLPGKNLIDELRFDKETSHKRFVITLFKCFLANYFRYEIQETDYIRDEPELADNKKREQIKEQNTIQVLQKYLKMGQTVQSVKACCEKLSKIKRRKHIRNGGPARTEDKFGNFKAIIDLINLENIRQNGYYIDLCAQKELEHFDQILNLYFDANTITHFMNFQWVPRISGGEMSQLNIYSRLLSVLKTDGSGYGSQSSEIVVFFDEIETTIHPKLQRRLVSNLIEFFNAFFKNSKFKAHLIFASHSPILLSDIPKDQTVLLHRNNFEENSVSIKNSDNETFAANIHILYEHHFRMGEKDENLIGQFASEKIREIVVKIEGLDSKVIDHSLVDEIERELSVVGEPFMKHKITELLEEKMHKTSLKRFREIRLRQLKEETEQLEKEIEDESND